MTTDPVLVADEMYSLYNDAFDNVDLRLLWADYAWFEIDYPIVYEKMSQGRYSTLAFLHFLLDDTPYEICLNIAEADAALRAIRKGADAAKLTIQYETLANEQPYLWHLLTLGTYDRKNAIMYLLGDLTDKEYLHGAMHNNAMNAFLALKILIAKGDQDSKIQASLDFSRWNWLARYKTAYRLFIEENRFDNAAFSKYIQRSVYIGMQHGRELAKREGEYLLDLLVSEGIARSSAQTQSAEYVLKLCPPPVRKPEMELPPDVVDSREVAAKMWALYRSKPDMWKLKKYEEQLADFRVAGFASFMKKYSIVSRYMINQGSFNAQAFDKYLKKLARIGYKTQADWADREADYAVYLWRKCTPHGNTKQGKELWKQTRDGLEKEMKDFKDDFEEAKKKVDDQKLTVAKKSKSDLLAAIQNNPKLREQLQLQMMLKKAGQDAANLTEEKREALHKLSQHDLDTNSPALQAYNKT